jgi:hypothetical protein
MIPFLAAQCVMCFRTAAAQNHARANVLDIGVLLLGIPPFLILAGYCMLFYKKNLVTRAGREEPFPPEIPPSEVTIAEEQ